MKFEVNPLDVVGGLLQPSLWKRSNSGHDRSKLLSLHDGGRNLEANLAMGSLNRHHLQVRILASRLLRRAELPLARVSVPNVLRVVSLFTADLTDFGHEIALWEDHYGAGPTGFARGMDCGEPSPL